MKKDLISIDDLGLEQILDYLDLAARVEALPNAEKAALVRQARDLAFAPIVSASLIRDPADRGPA